MLGGDATNNGKTEEDSHTSSNIQNGQSDMMAELKAFLSNEIKEGLALMKNELIHHFENRCADLTEQHAVLQSNMEEIEKKFDKVEKGVEEKLAENGLIHHFENQLEHLTEQQAVLQSNMEENGKKVDTLIQVEKKVEEKLAANCAMLEMLQSQVTHAASFTSSDHTVPEHRFHQRATPTDDSAWATGWPSCARSLFPFSRWIGSTPPEGESRGNPANVPQPPSSMSLTRTITTVTTVASRPTVQMVLNQRNCPSMQMSNAVPISTNASTIPTFTCQQPRTHTQSDQAHVISRGSFGQNCVSRGQKPQNISYGPLAVAMQFFNPSGNHHLRLILQDVCGNTMNSAVVDVNDKGHQVASWTQSVSDHTVLPSAAFDQNFGFPHLPPQISTRRRASCGGTVLNEKVILKLSQILGPHWRRIGIECLDFSSDNLRTITDEIKETQDKIFEMLKKWHRNQGSEGGTIEKLAELFKKSFDIDPDVHAYMNSLINSAGIME